jgi:hypothetical protein
MTNKYNSIHFVVYLYCTWSTVLKYLLYCTVQYQVQYGYQLCPTVVYRYGVYITIILLCCTSTRTVPVQESTCTSTFFSIYCDMLDADELLKSKMYGPCKKLATFSECVVIALQRLRKNDKLVMR